MDDKKNNENKYNPGEIEAKWQEKWESDKTFSPDVLNAKNPYYNLMMFPYPSAEGLHVGNMYAFTGADVYAKFQRMQGKDVLEPIGLDGFGIHSENYAMKVGRHPKGQAQLAEKNFYRQLRSIGNSFDWQRTLETYDPNYYKWTQWLFIQLFKAGLAYRDTALVNWCPKDLTVLSDEQVIDGCCERCGTKVEKKNLEQWFFRITKYADRLLNNIEGLDWSNKVKIAQTNWIGKSEGAEVEFQLISTGPGGPPVASPDIKALTVFTTRPDTLYGVTFMVIAPEHPLAEQVVNGQWSMVNGQEVKKYIESVKDKTEIERTGEGKEKTGVDTGIKAINPVNGEQIPIWIADYVLSGYGTGAIMAVPAHDSRDYEFARKYNLPIKQVIQNQEARIKNKELSEAFLGKGILTNSGEWDELRMPNDMDKVLSDLEKRKIGVRKANFHLRDWLISRQRYWGPPIPMIFCQNCRDAGKSWFTENKAETDKAELRIKNHELREENHNSKFITHNSKSMPGWYPVSEAELPVLLPNVEDWKPMGTGKSPLANHPEFYKTTCPSCGGKAVRETDVSDTFLDSSWYFLRYPSVGIENGELRLENVAEDKEVKQKAQISNPNSQLPWEAEITKKWLPVDMYIGGAEHSVLHLLYARFVTMVLHDLEYLNFEEPFSRFFAHGLIIKDGVKMSKSKGNVVVPDEYISKYGADTLRAYLMFIGPYSDGGDFRDSGIEGLNKFLRKVWKLLSSEFVGPVFAPPPSDNPRFASSTAGVRQGSPSASHPEYALSNERNMMMHKTIKGVTDDISKFGYNTAIAKLMEWYNYLNQESRIKNQELSKEEVKVYLKLLAPFAPHMTEELWNRMNQELRIKNQEVDQNHNSQFIIHNSIHLSSWPEFDAEKVVSDIVIIPVQINGKRRGEIEVPSSNSQELVSLAESRREDRSQLEMIAREAVAKYLEGVEVKKVIYIPGKIFNFVV